MKVFFVKLALQAKIFGLRKLKQHFFNLENLIKVVDQEVIVTFKPKSVLLK